MLKLFCTAVLTTALLSSLSFGSSPKSDWKEWLRKDLEEKKSDPFSLFSLTDYIELRPGEQAYLSLDPVKSDPRWLKEKPTGPHAHLKFDGTDLRMASNKETIEKFQSQEWKAPNGLVTRSSSAKRGYVWIYLHAPMRSKFSKALLPWFPFDPRAVVRATIDRSRRDDKPVVKTTKGDTRDYKVIGVAKFSYGGKEHELQLFNTNPEKPSDVFIAFKDGTNDKTTYGGGRYVEAKLEDPQSNELTIDFNRAYNPYCAYSRFYNCPLVSGNRLSVPLTAGAKLPPRRLDGDAH